MAGVRIYSIYISLSYVCMSESLKFSNVVSKEFVVEKVLKSDVFGRIELGMLMDTSGSKVMAVKRSYSCNFFLHLPSKILGNNEKRALNKLQTYTKTESFPSVLDCGWNYHIRSYIPGQMLYNASDKISSDYFLQAKSILREMRKLGVANNDLAKEANWLVKSDGTPAIVDFQLAVSGNLLAVVTQKKDCFNYNGIKSSHDKHLFL